MTTAVDAGLLAAAQTGDEEAFRRLVQPYARELHVHCYRMLGSFHDAEDALQETLLRAWRHLGGFEPRGSFRAWLYRIATNVSLTLAQRRKPVELPPQLPYPATPEGEVVVLTAYPDALLDELPSTEPGPESRYDVRESVQLAFVAAVQTLPPRQRAVLLLRDVLGWSAREVAELLESTTAGVNSALQRARETLETRTAAGLLRPAAAPADTAARSLVRRYVDAWEAADVDGLVALLREDAIMTMPPVPVLFRGRQAIGEFFATVPLGGALDRMRLIPTRANFQPAVAAYVPDPEAGVLRPYGIMVLTVDGDAIAEITGFANPALFEVFGLSEVL